MSSPWRSPPFLLLLAPPPFRLKSQVLLTLPLPSSLPALTLARTLLLCSCLRHNHAPRLACKCKFPKPKGYSVHLSQKAECHAISCRILCQRQLFPRKPAVPLPPPDDSQSTASSPSSPPRKHARTGVTIEEVEDEGDPPRRTSRPTPSSSARVPLKRTGVTVEEVEDEGDPPHRTSRPTPSSGAHAPPKRTSVALEEVEDKGDPPRASHTTPFSTACPPPNRAAEGAQDKASRTTFFPSLYKAGKTYGSTPTSFERRFRKQQEAGEEPWAPFASRSEVEYANWFVSSGMSHKEIDNHLKLTFTRERAKPSFKDKRQFFKKFDQLPHGPEWRHDAITVIGDLCGSAPTSFY
ncbi:hypothetical protein BOTBODRAFT_173160 [Botryobasidium botryosum FD-172 SS1]|uniref:Uncharacterized protein n=1 Tax=Botryobasidium botryosum (strain FD-172 SS1) TaxID=930990 RepID=A0A067MWK3_BOTB1|nr:hypothetical protein BOTBODRAFT_173160 [Botryobasidium botryosum FD-172 SS1]